MVLFFFVGKDLGLLKFISIILMRLREKRENDTFVHFMLLNCSVKGMHGIFAICSLFWFPFFNLLCNKEADHRKSLLIHWLLGWFGQSGMGKQWKEKRWQEVREKSEYVFHQISSSGSPQVGSSPYKKPQFLWGGTSFSHFL